MGNCQCPAQQGLADMTLTYIKQSLSTQLVQDHTRLLYAMWETDILLSQTQRSLFLLLSFNEVKLLMLLTHSCGGYANTIICTYLCYILGCRISLLFHRRDNRKQWLEGVSTGIQRSLANNFDNKEFSCSHCLAWKIAKDISGFIHQTAVQQGKQSWAQGHKWNEMFHGKQSLTWLPLAGLSHM